LTLTSSTLKPTVLICAESEQEYKRKGEERKEGRKSFSGQRRRKD